MWVWEHELFGHNPKRPDSTKKDKTVEVITKADHDAALRRAKAEGAREMIKIVNDNKADQRVADNLDNTLNFDSFNEVLDTITCEIDARAAQIEEGE